MVSRASLRQTGLEPDCRKNDSNEPPFQRSSWSAAVATVPAVRPLVPTRRRSAGEAETGVTIHLVDEVYDHGARLAQATVPVLPGDTAETLAVRVQAREQELFPEVLRRIIAGEIDLDRV